MSPDNKKLELNIILLSHFYRVRKIFRKIFGLRETTYVWERLDRYSSLWEKAAVEINADIEELTEGIWEVCRDGKYQRLSKHTVELDNPVVWNIAGNKPLSYSLMKKCGIPIPDYEVFQLNELNKMHEFMEKYTPNDMFVIKPSAGTSAGMGITTHMKTYTEVRRAAALAAIYHKNLIIERLIPGEIYRLLLLGGKMIYASRRTGLRLVGDGKSTIGQLLQKENERRMLDKQKSKLPVGFDLDYETTLNYHGLNDNSVIDSGHEILVKSIDGRLDNNEEIRTVYTENVTKLICPEIQESAAKACNAINTEFAGVDIIMMDPSVSLEKSCGVIGELNTSPGLHHHCNLINGDEKPSAAAKVLNYIFEKQL